MLPPCWCALPRAPNHSELQSRLKWGTGAHLQSRLLIRQHQSTQIHRGKMVRKRVPVWLCFGLDSFRSVRGCDPILTKDLPVRQLRVGTQQRVRKWRPQRAETSGYRDSQRLWRRIAGVKSGPFHRRTRSMAGSRKKRSPADLPIDRTRSILVGDSLRDIGAARAIGIWAYSSLKGEGLRAVRPARV
jgi:hypothetical protein